MPAVNQESEGGPARAARRSIKGVVVSDKASKTRVVDVERRVRHAFYDKVVTRRSRFYVHDEGGESRSGDVVEIMSCRPMSRLKRWRLVRVVRKGASGSRPAGPEEGAGA